MDNELPPELMDEVLQCIYQGEKIRAIKLYRKYRQVSLLESKQFIEELTKELRSQQPERFPPQGSSGCFGVLAALWLGIALLSFLVADYCT